jgi:hypothetical protein
MMRRYLAESVFSTRKDGSGRCTAPPTLGAPMGRVVRGHWYGRTGQAIEDRHEGDQLPWLAKFGRFSKLFVIITQCRQTAYPIRKRRPNGADPETGETSHGYISASSEATDESNIRESDLRLTDPGCAGSAARPRPPGVAGACCTFGVGGYEGPGWCETLE